MIKIWGVKIV